MSGREVDRDALADTIARLDRLTDGLDAAYREALRLGERLKAHANRLGPPPGENEAPAPHPSSAELLPRCERSMDGDLECGQQLGEDIQGWAVCPEHGRLGRYESIAQDWRERAARSASGADPPEEEGA